MGTGATLQAVINADEDFEWYPTTDRMIAVVAKRLPAGVDSIMDVGAGDGRVLVALSAHLREAYADREAREYRDRCSKLAGFDVAAHRKGAYDSFRGPKLYAIEKSAVLSQAQPDDVIPVGTDLFEQNLACLPADVIFCNPPYSQYEAWASAVIESGYAKSAFLVIPRRWKESAALAASLKRRGATAKVIHSDDFHDAERRARAVVDIVEVNYPRKHDWGGRDEVKDPFDIWFDQNIDTFDREADVADDDDEGDDDEGEKGLAKLRGLDSIGDLVDAFNEEYARMEANYRAIFKLDGALLKELQVSKEGVREGIKKRMAGLKTKYWRALFEKLDTITSRLSTATKASFLEKLTARTSVAFTNANAYAVTLWAIKNANKYYDAQLVQLFRDLSTFDGVQNYKSNQRAWAKDGWRYGQGETVNTHYALDYRIVVARHGGISTSDYGRWEAAGGLEKRAHELIDDVIAVLGNLGFCPYAETASWSRSWAPNEWQDWADKAGRTLFQVKAFKNGNLHFRFRPDAIRVLNVEAGRLLGWLRGPADVVAELGYTPEEAAAAFGANRMFPPSSLRLLGGPVAKAS
jgi:hypothetical protein